MTNTSSSVLFRTWASDVREIKQLFNARKYKRCAAKCEELEVSAIHPLHRTFLHFHQALCYESLGIATHAFSSSKLPFLNLAKDCFDLAMEELSHQSYVNIHGDGENCFGTNDNLSPDCTTMNILERYQVASPLTQSEAVSKWNSGAGKENDPPKESDLCGDSNYSFDEEGNVETGTDRKCFDSSMDFAQPSTKDEVPNFDDYSPRRNVFGFSKTAQAVNFKSKQYPETPTSMNKPHFHVASNNKSKVVTKSTTSNHKVRLSQSLSSTHCLAEDLVPSPLFRQTKRLGETATLQTPSKPAKLVQDICLLQPPSQYAKGDYRSQNENNDLQPPGHSAGDANVSADERPLPPLPFNHKPHFQKRGSRYILVPAIALTGASDTDTKQRQSAIQTLVAQFEGKIQQSQQQYTPSTLQSTSPRTPVPKTPVTPRFKMISRAFGGEIDTSAPATTVNSVTLPIQLLTPATSSSRSAHNVKPSPASRIPLRAMKNLQTPTQRPPKLSKSPNILSINSATPSAYFTSTTIADSTSPSPDLDRLISSFQSSLESHIASITSRIDTVVRVQEERRAKGVKRDMSFWSFDVVTDTNNNSSGLNGRKRTGDKVDEKKEKRKEVRRRIERWKKDKKIENDEVFLF